MFIIKAVLAFPCKDVGSEKCNILSDISADVLIGKYTYTESYWGKLVVLANRQRKNAFTLRLRCIKKKIFSIEASPIQESDGRGYK
jgi:hypothetical protein